ncbi:MAG: hypothetical protein HUU50_13180 [Candidatus Brocadiae bacterium]|nr:hypothetical protein [Candidatus Brocadiia bacterium]
MKKLALLMVLVMVCTVVFADNFEKLQAAHKNAMKFYGRAELLTQRDAKMVVVQSNKDVASLFIASELVTGYMETDNNKKFYWEVTPIEGGVKIYIKVNVLGKVFEKTIIIKFGEKDLAVSADSTDERVDTWCIVKCAGSSALSCLYCGTNWVCWATCAGPGVISCIKGCF